MRVKLLWPIPVKWPGMSWVQNYTPAGGSLMWSAGVAAIPLVVLLVLLGGFRKSGWLSALAALAAAFGVVTTVYGMPASLALSASAYGAAFGLFPICWIMFWSIVLYRMTLATNRFEIIKDSIGSLTGDRRLQALLIAFCFGAFVEGAAGFGAPVAVAAAMLTGLGFSPFYAAGICLLANTAPVAFGSIGIPVLTLAGITGLPPELLSAMVGRLCAPVSLIIPAYLVVVMGGWRALRGVWPAAAACGVAYAGAQIIVSNLLGPQLTDILSSLAGMVALIAVLKTWKPRDSFALPGDSELRGQPPHHTANEVFKAWLPYGFLVLCVLAWGSEWVKPLLGRSTFLLDWPLLHNAILQQAPAVAHAGPYAARYKVDWLTASGTACLLACLLTAVAARMRPSLFLKVVRETAVQLARPILTVSAVLALAFLMNYSGATATLGLGLAATGVAFPFFSAMLGWIGVFLTGSDTSANALFGSLQVVTANHLKLSPVLMAAANSSGGVMGKMISLQSIAVAVAATGLAQGDESRLFRFTLKHSILLASMIGLIVLFYAYVMPGWVPGWR
jgi:lactate permease